MKIENKKIHIYMGRKALALLVPLILLGAIMKAPSALADGWSSPQDETDVPAVVGDCPENAGYSIILYDTGTKTQQASQYCLTGGSGIMDGSTWTEAIAPSSTYSHQVTYITINSSDYTACSLAGYATCLDTYMQFSGSFCYTTGHDTSVCAAPTPGPASASFNGIKEVDSPAADVFLGFWIFAGTMYFVISMFQHREVK